MNEKMINVLGTEWTLKELNREQDPTLENCDGYTDSTTKVCVIDSMGAPCPGKKQDLSAYKEKVIRHELIHAFLSECGLEDSSWAANEEIVDWIANQFPKLFKMFREADAI